jgi:hypothetical protein
MTEDEREKEISQEVVVAAHLGSEAKPPAIQKPSHEKTREQETKTQQEPETTKNQPPHTILTEKEKIFTIIVASFAAFISPVSAAIYFPALPSLSRDLHVSISTINLTITVYMVPPPSLDLPLI